MCPREKKWEIMVPEEFEAHYYYGVMPPFAMGSKEKKVPFFRTGKYPRAYREFSRSRELSDHQNLSEAQKHARKEEPSRM